MTPLGKQYVLRSAYSLVGRHTEMPLSGAYAGGPIRGSADLVLGAQGDRRAILDLKWGRWKHHAGLLEENRHLQLALYAELLRQQTGAWPAVAYFLLEAGRLVARRQGLLPRCANGSFPER